MKKSVKGEMSDEGGLILNHKPLYQGATTDIDVIDID